jgi:hypothetical protein
MLFEETHLTAMAILEEERDSPNKRPAVQNERSTHPRVVWGTRWSIYA